MGSVWLAERNDGRFERRVAVKFLNIALMRKGGKERFKREGRILTRLVHPHIAELIDAGCRGLGNPISFSSTLKAIQLIAIAVSTIHPASYGPESINHLIADVSDAIERHLPALPSLATSKMKYSGGSGDKE